MFVHLFSTYTQTNTWRQWSHISMSSPGTGPHHSKWHEACTGIPLCAWCEHFAKRWTGKPRQLWSSGQVRALCTWSRDQLIMFVCVCVSVCVCLSACVGVCGCVFGCGLVFVIFYLVSNLFVFFDNVWERNISYHNLPYGIIAYDELSSLLMMSYHNLVMKSFERLW